MISGTEAIGIFAVMLVIAAGCVFYAARSFARARRAPRGQNQGSDPDLSGPL